jgi:hypothetical protein
VHCQERQYPGFFKSLVRIGREEGVKGLWRGTGAALLREASYSSIRMGLYDPLKHVRVFGERFEYSSGCVEPETCVDVGVGAGMDRRPGTQPLLGP